MKIEEFIKVLSENAIIFEDNMNHLKMRPQTFPEWYNMFGAWLDVGTSMESECWFEEKE